MSELDQAHRTHIEGLKRRLADAHGRLVESSNALGGAQGEGERIATVIRRVLAERDKAIAELIEIRAALADDGKEHLAGAVGRVVFEGVKAQRTIKRGQATLDAYRGAFDKLAALCKAAKPELMVNLKFEHDTAGHLEWLVGTVAAAIGVEFLPHLTHSREGDIDVWRVLAMNLGGDLVTVEVRKKGGKLTDIDHGGASMQTLVDCLGLVSEDVRRRERGEATGPTREELERRTWNASYEMPNQRAWQKIETVRAPIRGIMPWDDAWGAAPFEGRPVYWGVLKEDEEGGARVFGAALHDFPKCYTAGYRSAHEAAIEFFETLPSHIKAIARRGETLKPPTPRHVIESGATGGARLLQVQFERFAIPDDALDEWTQGQRVEVLALDGVIGAEDKARIEGIEAVVEVRHFIHWQDSWGAPTFEGRPVYWGVVHHEERSDYGVSFPDFPGCISAGESIEDAQHMGHEALRFHIEGMVEDGDAMPTPSSRPDAEQGAPRAVCYFPIKLYPPGEPSLEEVQDIRRREDLEAMAARDQPSIEGE